MSALHSIAMAIQVATQKRDAAGSVLLKAQHACRFGYSQLEQLEAYALEKDAKWMQSASVGVAPGLMFHHFEFMHRLRHAIGLQQSVLQGLEQQLSNAQRTLLEAEFRLVRLKHLLQERRSDQQRRQTKLEQKQTDDIATNQFRHSSSLFFNGELR